MIERVISGGQTGADQAGWRAAKAAGIATGGWMPKGFKTEDGYRPDFEALFGAKAHGSASYRDRTISNITLADVSLLFGNPNSPGSKLLIASASDLGLPVFKVRWHDDGPTSAYMEGMIRRWHGSRSPLTINVAGNRESSAPGIGAWVEPYLADLFRLLKGG